MNFNKNCLKAVKSKLIVQIDKEYLDTPSRSSGGIYLPVDQQVKVMSGVITSICNSCSNASNSELKEGTRVIFGKYSCTELEGDFIGYASLRTEDILAIIET